MAKRNLNPRKVLVASVGVATVSYIASGAVACGSEHQNVGVANLVGPPPMTDAAVDARDASPTVANLVAPPPPTSDAAADADAARDATDADAL